MVSCNKASHKVAPVLVRLLRVAGFHQGLKPLKKFGISPHQSTNSGDLADTTTASRFEA
jgi:hypothetical protein